MFVEKPFWRPPYADDVSHLLSEIPVYFERVKQFVNQNENEEYMEGFVTAYRNVYLTECNRGENTGTQTIEETELALTPGFYNCEDRNCKKTLNLSKAVDYLFGKSLYLERLNHVFNVDLAKTLNSIIGNGLFSNAGCYRKKLAKPAKSNLVYLEPHLIEQCMEDLFEDINEKLRCTQEWYDIATSFFVRFLYIHPFSNGNGRTARLLLSALLIRNTTVPVSLFPSLNTNLSSSIYLQCISEAHLYKNSFLLTSLIIESTHRTLSMCINVLDID